MRILQTAILTGLMAFPLAASAFWLPYHDFELEGPDPLEEANACLVTFERGLQRTERTTFDATGRTVMIERHLAGEQQEREYRYYDATGNWTVTLFDAAPFDDIAGGVHLFQYESDRMTRYEHHTRTRIAVGDLDAALALRATPPSSFIDFEYDSSGLLVGTLGDYDAQTFAYLDGRLVRSTMDYDTNGELDSDIAHTYDEHGNRISAGNVDATYDAAGRMITHTRDATNTTTYVYEGDNLVRATRNTRVTNYGYDEQGRLTWATEATDGVQHMSTQLEYDCVE